MSTVDILLTPDPKENTRGNRLERETIELQATDLFSDVDQITAKNTPGDFGYPRVYDRARRRTLVSAQFPRFVARLLDLSWEGAMVAMLALPAAGKLIDSPITYLQIYGIFLIVLPLTLLLDSFIESVFGNTIGKRLVGLKIVTWEGAKLSFRNALLLNFSFWKSTLAFGILPLTIYTLFKQFFLAVRSDQPSRINNPFFRIDYEPIPWTIQLVISLGLAGAVAVAISRLN